MDFKLTHIRHDRAHCLAPGLFRSLKRGERKNNKLDVKYEFGEKDYIRFIGFEPLGADDLRLLQGLIALGGPNGIILTTEPSADMPKQLRLLLEPRLDAVHQNGLAVHTRLGTLMAEIGYEESGDKRQQIVESLRRISNVTVIAHKGTREASYKILSYAFDEEDGRLFVALNPRLTEAIIGSAPYTRIEMSEVRALKSDPTRLMHQRLCGWIDQGKTGNTEIETLCSYVWPEPAKTPSTERWRRHEIKKAIIELSAIGWEIEEYASGKYKIIRPRKTSEKQKAVLTQTKNPS
jgi:Replication protein C (RepC)